MAVVTHKATIGGTDKLLLRVTERMNRLAKSIAILEKKGTPKAKARLEALKAEHDGHKNVLRSVKTKINEVDLD